MPELLARAARSVDERFCKLLIRAGHRANPEGYKHERALGLRVCPVLERSAEDGAADSSLPQVQLASWVEGD